MAVCQAAMGISSDRQFLGLIGRVLPGWFPHLPEQSQYNRRLRGLVELISLVQQGLARWLTDEALVRTARDRARVRAQAYSWDRVSDQYAELLSRLVLPGPRDRIPTGKG